MGKFNGKVVLVTGGARGQGASHVRQFIEEGAKVLFTDILVEDGEALANELGENAIFMKHDVRSETEWKSVAAKAESTFGPIHVLVNNAGIVITKKFDEMAEEEYRRVIDINQIGVFLGMKSVVPSMKKAKEGSIINISSINGLRGASGTFAYDASKFAVRGMTKSAALELAEYGIRVNSIHPGIIETPMIAQDDVQDSVQALSKKVPLKRLGQPEDITKLVLFLASDDSSYSTGSEFIVDGGVTAKY